MLRIQYEKKNKTLKEEIMIFPYQIKKKENEEHKVLVIFLGTKLKQNYERKSSFHEQKSSFTVQPK